MALIGLKQLDNILTGSLQVSGSAGVTGSIKATTGSFGRLEGRIDFSKVDIDSGTIDFNVDDKWKSLLEICLITTIGAYFGSRGFEKIKKK